MTSIGDPFIGRHEELAGLDAALEEVLVERGRVIVLSGEAGIGKTRLALELAKRARAKGAAVLWGSSHEGEWAPAYGPFVEALTEYIRGTDPEELRKDVGFGAGAIARIIPAVRERLAGIEKTVALQPDEERYRLLDAMSQFLIVTSARRPLVLVTDDLQWADRDTVALLRHLARFISRHRILLMGIYRAGAIAAAHPLNEALAVMRRESSHLAMSLNALTVGEIGQLLEALLGERGGTAEIAAGISAQTHGNPFLVRELIHQLVDGRQLERRGEGWALKRPLAEVGVPPGVRQLVALRLKRLSPRANRLLQVASGFHGPFRCELVAAIAGFDDATALDALDEAIEAQFVRAVARMDAYEFNHELIRHSIYAGLNPSRQVRLHRRMAEAMERMSGSGAIAHAGDIAYQYRRSASLPGAERGAEFAMAAADDAESDAAYSEVAGYLETALDLLPRADGRRPRLLGRFATALIWALELERATEAAAAAARMIAASEGSAAAASYLAQFVLVLRDVEADRRGAHRLGELGLQFNGPRRDVTWAILKSMEVMNREYNDNDWAGGSISAPERREIDRLLREAGIVLGGFRDYASRGELRTYTAGPSDANYFFLSGEYSRGLDVFRQEALSWERQGRLAVAAIWWLMLSRFHCALGEFDHSRQARERGTGLAVRLPQLSVVTLHLLTAEDEWRHARDQAWHEPIPGVASSSWTSSSPGAYYQASTHATAARIHARMGRIERSMRRLSSVISTIDQAPGWADSYVRIVCDAVEALWLTRRVDHIDVLERNVRAKVIATDFRYPMMDGRLAMARLSALQGRREDAVDWFAQARVVLDEEGSSPLRAIADYDEALMYVRSGDRVDRELARPLLAKALSQFRTIDMPGWIRRAEHLLERGDEWKPESSVATRDRWPTPSEGSGDVPRKLEPPTAEPGAVSPAVFRKEGDFWLIIFGDRAMRLKSIKGLGYVAVLLRYPGREFHALELGAEVDSYSDDASPVRRHGAHVPGMSVSTLGDAGLMHDSAARSAYRQRLEELHEELLEAETFNDAGKVAKLRAEMEALLGELDSGMGLGRRTRKAGSPSERARLNVTRAIKSALKRIGEGNRPLADHLRRHLRTGLFCSYDPDPRAVIDWEL